MDERWSIDFKKFKKTSSKKFIKGGLGFFLSPREELGDVSGSKNNSNLSGAKKSNSWNNESSNLPESSSVVEVQDKDFIDDIPVIPSLDDFVDDDLPNQIANAPLVGVKHVGNLKDLETDLLQHSAFASLEEVNLQVLVKLLHRESHLDEPDVLWTKDSLFNEMVTEHVENKFR